MLKKIVIKIKNQINLIDIIINCKFKISKLMILQFGLAIIIIIIVYIIDNYDSGKFFLSPNAGCPGMKNPSASSSFAIT